MLIKQSHRIG